MMFRLRGRLLVDGCLAARSWASVGLMVMLRCQWFFRGGRREDACKPRNRQGHLKSPHDVIDDVTGTEPPNFASPKTSDLVIAALIGGVAGAALTARSNRVA